MNRILFTRSGEVEVDPGEVQALYSGNVLEQYIAVALMTALAYHSLLTMDKEVKYFWLKPFNQISLIYFANRWVGILGAVCAIIANGLSESLSSCIFSFWTQAVCILATAVLVDYILVVRVLALYQQDRRLAIILKCLLALDVVSGLAVLIYGGILERIGVVILAKNVAVCTIGDAPPIIIGICSWAIPLTFGLILLVLALSKAAEFRRLSFGFRGFVLVKVLIRDQVLYYGFVIFFCTLRIAGASTFISNPVLANIFTVLANPTILCIFGSQLLINLKEAGELGVNGGTNYRTTNVTDIDFADGPGPQAEEVSREQSITGSAV